jgi:hypothetical protein
MSSLSRAVPYVRLALLLGVFGLVVSREEPVQAASYCCDTCVGVEDKFYSECPGGAEQSQDCNRLNYSMNHCWNFCNFSLCNAYEPRPYCQSWIFPTPPGDPNNTIGYYFCI